MKIKKIFFIADAKSIHTAKWVDYFVDKNYDVYLATFANINNTKCRNIYFLSDKTTKNMGGNYHYLFSVGKLAKLFQDIKPDIINAHFSYSMGFISLLAKKRAKIKANFTIVCHGSDILSPPKPYIMDKLNKYILQRCDKIFVVSDQIKDKIENFGIDISKIFIGQYGIDMTIEKNSVKDIDILSNRAYIPNSRIDFLLEAIDSLNRKDLHIVFVLANISEYDFNKLSTKYSYITFYKGIEYNEMMQLMSRAKIYISATKSDGTALSLLEAMHYHLIPLVSNIVSNRSWVLDTLNGYLFNNKKDFIEKLSKILNIREEDKSIICNFNIKLLENKGNYNTQMKKIETFLMEEL